MTRLAVTSHRTVRIPSKRKKCVTITYLDLTQSAATGLIRALSATCPQNRFARVAQSVEQRIENPRVGGSIPPPGTIFPSQLVQNILKSPCFSGLNQFKLYRLVHVASGTSRPYRGQKWGHIIDHIPLMPPKQCETGQPWRLQTQKPDKLNHAKKPTG